MHKALQNALRNQFRIDYFPAGGFIKHIRTNRDGVLFKFNTWLITGGGMTAGAFINYDYNKVLDDLQRSYYQSITDNTYQLKSEFYQDRYGKL